MATLTKMQHINNQLLARCGCGQDDRTYVPNASMEAVAFLNVCHDNVFWDSVDTIRSIFYKTARSKRSNTTSAGTAENNVIKPYIGKLEKLSADLDAHVKQCTECVWNGSAWKPSADSTLGSKGSMSRTDQYQTGSELSRMKKATELFMRFLPG